MSSTVGSMKARVYFNEIIKKHLSFTKYDRFIESYFHPEEDVEDVNQEEIKDIFGFVTRPIKFSLTSRDEFVRKSLRNSTDNALILIEDLENFLGISVGVHIDVYKEEHSVKFYLIPERKIENICRTHQDWEKAENFISNKILPQEAIILFSFIGGAGKHIINETVLRNKILDYIKKNISIDVSCYYEKIILLGEEMLGVGNIDKVG